jgi:Amt family ammonium transporter
MVSILSSPARRPGVIAALCAAVAGASLLAVPAGAQELSGGDTAWILTATALVLFMTLPGLALFYGGLVAARNVLSVFTQCFAVACLASVLWLVVGYSLAFGDGGPANAVIGGFAKAYLKGVDASSVSGTIPELLFFMFQMTFAIITPALIIGAFVERARFPAVLIFSGLWLLLVYAPVAHWVWGGGWLAQRGVLDFAGGLVVHATAGTSAIAFVLALGPRRGFPQELTPPHSPGLTFAGAAMLWVGWFGFNAGSALSAGGSAAMAMTVTHVSAATASLVWMTIEWIKFGKPSLIGLVTGMVAGLATITPAAGSVGPAGALAIGALAGAVCYYAVRAVKIRFRFDDSLDVFAVHGVGGVMGTLLIPLFAGFGPGAPGLREGVTFASQLGAQALGVVAVVAWSAAGSFAILWVVKLFGKLRVEPETETEGLDVAAHGERSYNL